MTRLILHAGTHKTGTTTIQHCLHDRRDELAEAAVRYPGGLRKTGRRTWRSHNWIAQAFTGRYDYSLHEVEDAVDSALLGCGDDDSLMLSAEDLSACCAGHRLWKGLDQHDFRALQRDYLLSIAKFFERFEIEPVIVFRRADEYAQSLYQTLVRSDHFLGGFESFLDYAAPLFDYRAQIEAFEQAFGHTNVLSFKRLGDGNFVDSFLQAIGVGFRPGPTPSKNISTDARLTYWKTTREAEGETAMIKEFFRSESARSLFSDFGAATFWPSERDRANFHDRSSLGLPENLFGPLRMSGMHVDARLDDVELNHVSRAYLAWKKALPTEPSRPVSRSFWQRLTRARP